MEGNANTKFLTGEPNFITQYVRGKLYILVDVVLSISKNIKNSRDMKLILDFIEGFIQFFVKYLEDLPILLTEVKVYKKDY